VFFGTFIGGLDVKFSTKIPTCGTNGKVIVFNPFFLKGLNKVQLYGLIIHEVAHVALGHHLRRGARDFKIWNVACDYAINLILRDAGIALPKGGLISDKYKDQSAEQIYATLVKQGGVTEREGEEGDKGRVDDQPTQERKNKPKGGKPNDKPDTKKPPQEGEGEGEEGEEAEQGNGEAESDKPEGKGKTNGKGQRDPDKPQNPQPQDPGDSDDEESGDEGEDEEDGEGDDEDDDFGGGGEDDDDPYADPEAGDYSNLSDVPTHLEAETEWRLKVSQAELVAKGVGNLPGSLTCELAKIKEEKVCWKSALADLLTEVTQDDFSYAKPNKLFSQSDILFPGAYNENIGPIVIGVDTSGSRWSQEVMDKTAAEITGILSAFTFPEVHVVYCDTAVRHVDILGPNDPVEFKPYGGGGTEFKPVFQYIDEEGLAPAALIYITDLEIYREDYPEYEPNYKVIWAAIDAGSYWVKNVPFGHVLKIDSNEK
jgi:predicted metal-dependent peptidase